MERSTVEDSNAPESWEVADVEESMKRLLLSSSKDSSAAKDSSAPSDNNNNNNSSTVSADDFASNSLNLGFSSGAVNSDNAALSKDAINSVDQFLREALQNPRERLSILRMEQDVEQFIQDPMRQQMEFQQLPTSYLRLAAHRVAQHYFLQSMVLLDNSLPDGSGSRIIVQKTSTECRLPRIRLADIPVNLPQEDGVVKVAIKQRPQKHSSSGGGNSGSQKSQNSKSVEERKEEYNRARARIFNSNNHYSSPGVKAEIEPKKADSLELASLALPRVNEKSASGVSDLGSGRTLAVVDSPSGSSRSARNRTEKEPVNRNRSNNRVAIFRDREIDRKDPDYDRNYDRYLQRFDPGFGFNAGPYTVQPMYTPAVNYNTEFPQLGVTPRPQISADPQRPIPQHIPGPWTSPSNPAGLAYGHPEAMMAAYSPSHVNPQSASAIYLHTTQFPCQRPGMPFIHPHEHIHQAYQQSQQQQHDATLGFARPR